MTKKKRGRKKKRGPKKKLPPKIYKPRNTWNYKIVSCRNQKQNGYYGKFSSAKDAYAFVDVLLEDSKSVVFPKKVVNSKGVDECVDEYLILERRVGDEKTPLLRNEYGKLVEHKTNTERWIVFDKFRYDVEETFWVYGYDPQSGRKTFMWVYENLLVGDIEGKYDIKRVILYNNKIVVKNDRGEIEIVFCKTRSDAIRFYNMLQEKVLKDGYTQVFFEGARIGNGDKTSKLIDELCEYTGWGRRKVIKSGLKS